MKLPVRVRRAAVSLAFWCLPLAIFPPWVHRDPIDHAFWTHTFGEFDRHGLFWRPPFAEQVARDPQLKSPVVVDVPRLVRELLVSAAITYWVLALVGEARASDAQRWLLRISLPKLAALVALVALLLPIPPVGVLAFTSWESLTDFNHGVFFLFPYLLYWLVLAVGTYIVLWIVRYIIKRMDVPVGRS